MNPTRQILSQQKENPKLKKIVPSTPNASLGYGPKRKRRPIPCMCQRSRGFGGVYHHIRNIADSSSPAKVASPTSPGSWRRSWANRSSAMTDARTVKTVIWNAGSTQRRERNKSSCPAINAHVVDFTAVICRKDVISAMRRRNLESKQHDL